ncbi:MAG: cell division protein FtsX [Chitinophagales bacterium]
MSLMLWLLGISFSVYLEYRPFTQTLKERLPLIVELTPTFNETDAPSMRKQLMDQPEIKEAVFVSRAEAAEVVRADLGDDIGELIGDSLYPTFTVHLNHQFVSNNQLVSIKESLENIEGVSYVFVPEVNLDVVNANLKRGALITGGLGLLFLFVSLVLLDHSIRLSLYSRRFLIRSMQLVGATSAFIKRPFLWRGLLRGFFSAVLGISLLIGTLYAIEQSNYPIQLLHSYDKMGLLIAAIVTFSIFVSLISTYRSVNRYLRMRLENLYSYYG